MSSRAVTSTNSRNAADDCAACHYCDLPFGLIHHEHDHAPTPQSANGVDIVPTCVTCHDLKDRAGLRGWPAAQMYGAVQGLMERGLLGSALLGAPPVAWPDDWSEMSRWERLLWARIVKLAHMAEPPSDLLWMTMRASA